MNEVEMKKHHFHEEIRRKQKDLIFKKIRKQLNERTLFLETDYHHMCLKLNQLHGACLSIEELHAKQEKVEDYLTQLRRMQNFPTGNVLDEVFNFLVKLNALIQSNTVMDIELEQGIKEVYEKNTPFMTVLYKISNFLINFLAERDQIVIEYTKPVKQLMKDIHYIDCFHNIFLNQKLQKQDKIYLYNIFLNHLSNNPSLYLSNLHKYTPILYYAVFQPPNILSQNSLHNPLIHLLCKQFSILQFNSNLTTNEKNDFRTYAYAILQRVCYKNLSNTTYLIFQITESQYLFQDLTHILTQHRRQIKKINHTNNKQIEEKHQFLNCLNFLINLTYYRDMISTLMKNKIPALWILLMEIYSILPNLNKYAANLTVQKILRLISNTIGDSSLCYDFIFYGNQQYKNIIILNKLFSHFYSMPNIRTQSMYILNNIISIICKEIKSEKQECQEFLRLCEIMQISQDMFYEVLRLDKCNEEIVYGVLNNMRYLIEEFGEQFIGKCQFIRNHAFVLKLKEINEGDDNEQENLYFRYSEKVMLSAQLLMEALNISDF